MDIRIKFKPMMIVGDSKETIMKKITSYGKYYWSSFGFGNAAYIGHRNNEQFIRLFTLEKRRRKCKQTDTYTLSDFDRSKSTRKKKVIRRAHWIAHVYTVPKAVFVISDMKVKQFHRTFKIYS